MRIMLDPGHGGNDPGAQANDIKEKEPNLKVALRAAAMLEAHGVEVLLTRTGDVAVSLSDRTDFANREKVDAFVSIHHNAAGNSSARGLEVYHSILGGEGKRLAQLIHDRFVAITGIPSRGVRTRKGSSGRDYYHVIRETRMPAVIVEGGFVTNPEDAALIKSAAFIEQEAQAISQGIVLWRGGSIMPEVPEWKQAGLKWLEVNDFITPGRWDPEDPVDMGTLGEILSRIKITGVKN